MRTIKKIIKKTIGVLFLVLLIIGGVIGYKGYERYKEVLEKVPLQEKIAEIRQKPCLLYTSSVRNRTQDRRKQDEISDICIDKRTACE